MRIFEKISRRLAITLAGVMACSSFAMAPALTAYAADEPAGAPKSDAEIIERVSKQTPTKLENDADYISEVTLGTEREKRAAAYSIHSDIDGKLRVTIKATDTIKETKVSFFKSGGTSFTAKGDIKDLAKDKTFELEANVTAGDYIINIRNFADTEAKFQIKAAVLTDKTTKIRNAESPAKKTAKVTIKKAKKVDGYEIRLSTSKDFDKNVKTKRVKAKKIEFKDKKGTIEKSGLKSGKKYYVQVRTYIKKNGVKYYSEWSKSKKIAKVK
ncbi:hypothetical protein [Butyrivibrio sp. FC2001]|uniref:hypothetical protein n=1 Tax=Butyrivibrio sp. FC2001 TaxID=1280671 RepID=UPI000414204E|nr:hypothetical protein [Butyrivibrio sp. FC2001]